MAIKPLDLPAAAGVDYSGGDVRHFSQGDAVNVPGLSAPTRNLAERDNLIGEKVNEIISTVNNREQFVPLPVIRTTVPPGEEIIVTNYRIPAGYESRVLNAVISATPTSNLAQLNVYYSDTYGGSTGTAVVTTTPSSEFNGDVNFYQTGEFIVSLKNTGAATLELAASLMLTMRPLGAEGTLLVGTVIQGEQGPPGPKGAPGPQGPPGTGGVGSPGMIWRGAWLNATGYLTNDVVSYDYSGTYGSWICRNAHVSSLGVNDPAVDPATWNFVSYGIYAQGPAGPTGPTGGEPVFSQQDISGTIFTSNTYVSRPYSADYTAGVVSAASTKYPIAVRESVITNASGTIGFAFLEASYKTCFSGSLSIILPNKAFNGAAANYNTSSISLQVAAAGTFVSAGTATNSSVSGGVYSKLFEQTTYSYGWGIKVLSPDALPMSFLISGVQSVP
jgi:hypothetical protein